MNHLPTLPLISFCIPVHNGEKYLGQTLDSILAQDYENIEIICVNDHSTDGTSDILKSYKGNIKYFDNYRKGAASARNLALDASNGQYIVFFDGDDLIDSNYCTSQIKRLAGSQDSVVICTWGRFYESLSSFKQDSTIVKRDLNFYEWILEYWPLNRHTTPPGRIVIPRAVVSSAGNWDESLSLNDDLDFFSRVFSKAKCIHFNNETKFYYRSGIGGLSSKTKGFERQKSNFSSIKKATDLAVLMFPNNLKIMRACANMWQLFVYENYPENPSLILNAEKRIIELKGADFPFPAGGFTSLMTSFFGWKGTKRIKRLIGNK